MTEAEELELLELEEAEAMVASGAAKAQPQYSQPIGPNPRLNMQTARGAMGDMVSQTAPGSRTFVPETGPAPVAGMPPMALPVGGMAQAGLNGLNLVGRGSKVISGVMGASAPARIGASTAVGAAQDTQNPLRGAGVGLVTGLGGEGLAKFLGGAGGAISRPKEVLKYAKDPAIEQNVAMSAIDDAHEQLTRSYYDKVQPLLENQKYKIDPRAFGGSVPEADDAIRQAMTNRPYPDLPSEIEIPATVGEKVRTALDRTVQYPKGTSVAIPKEVADKYVANKALADRLRAQRRIPGNEELASLYDDWSTAIGQGSDLQRKSGNPISALANESADNLALKLKVDRATGSDLTGLGEKFRAADSVRKAEGIARPAWELTKQSAKGAWEGGKNASGAGLEALIHKWMGRDK